MSNLIGAGMSRETDSMLALALNIQMLLLKCCKWNRVAESKGKQTIHPCGLHCSHQRFQRWLLSKKLREAT